MPLSDELKLLIRAMVSANDGTPGMAPDDFLAAAGIDDGSAFAHRTLVGSLAARDGEGVDLSMVLLEKFGGTLADVEPLLALTGQDWHSSSNEAFFRLEAIGRPEAIGPLRRIAQTPPRPFKDDLDERTLANNAVYSIARIGGPQARDALAYIARNNTVERQLLAAELLAGLIASRGEAAERESMRRFHATFRTVVESGDSRVGWSFDWGPFDLVEDWAESVNRVTEGRETWTGLSTALARRDQLQLAIDDASLRSWPTWVDLLRQIKRVDSEYLPAIAAGPEVDQRSPWWRRRLPARAGTELRAAIKQFHGFDLVAPVESAADALPYFLPESVLPDGFSYPATFRRMVSSGFVRWQPWELECAFLISRHRGLQRRYPARTLVPFARRSDRDDVACWDLDRPAGTVVVIDDFSPPGDEQSEYFDSFEAWLRSAVEDFITWED